MEYVLWRMLPELVAKVDLLVYDSFLAAKQELLSLLHGGFPALPSTKEDKSNANSTTELPEDMMMEIMSRCSCLDTFASFRASSKSLNALAYGTALFATVPIFSGFFQVKYHSKLVMNFIAGADPQLHPLPSISMDFLPKPWRIRACSDTTGLVFYDGNGLFYLCKPATKEWMEMAYPAYGNIGIYGMIVLSLNPLHFKILKVHNYRSSSYLYDSKTPGRWRKLGHVLMNLSENFLKSPVTVSGHIHFLANSGRVFAFDALTETWKIFSLPLEILYRKGERSHMKYKGKLSMLFMEECNNLQSFWIMDDYGKKLWRKKSYHQIYLEDGKHVKMASFSSSNIADSDLESYILFRNKLWTHGLFNGLEAGMNFQSDFQKMGWALDT